MSAPARKRLPPFAKGCKPLDAWLWVRCGERAWKLTREDPSPGNVVIFPKGRDPSAYRWPVRGYEVLAFQLDEELQPFLCLLVELLRQGARRVHARYSTGECITYDPADRKRAA